MRQKKVCSRFETESLEEAHQFCSNNKPLLAKANRCGCFSCLKIFSPRLITDYIVADTPIDRDGTARCPFCGIDAVLAEGAAYPLTKTFLRSMQVRWFGY